MQDPAALPSAAPGQVRRTGRARTGIRRGIDAVGMVGSLVTLTALLVLAATAGALADGVPAGGATVTATFER